MEDILFGIAKSILDVIAVSWWVILPVGLFFIWRDFHLWGMSRLWKTKIKWEMLEIRIPRNIEKTPKAMENVFSALHGLHFKNPSTEDKYLRGEEWFWLTCELVGHEGGVHFFIRFPKIFRDLVESAIYSEYPDAELIDAEDYTKLMPDVIPNDVYDLWGQDFILAKPNPYPIKTYEFFEESISERRLDPISTITEIMSRLKKGEAIWLQYLIRPVPDDWKEEGEEIRDSIMQRKKPEEKKGFIRGLIDGFFEFLKNLSLASVEHPTWATDEKKEEKSVGLYQLSPGEQNILKGIENKISKLGFETAIRLIYIDKKDSFTSSNSMAVSGAIKQFNTQNLNSFKMVGDTVTFVTGSWLTWKSWFRKPMIFYRKRLIMNYIKLGGFRRNILF